MGSLKAAYVYNIAKFTRWPESVLSTKENPFKLCLYGDDDTIAQLNLLANRSMQSHTILVKTITTETALNDCHILYISAKENRRYRYLLSLINRKTTLTISSDSRFLRLGGLINLTELEQRLQFEVNMEELAHSKLTLSSKLLKLGKLIEKPR
ncbi:MAG: YfiR family protein [Colwellia sp.]|nr:YfiR family protein [Colwellia sp.]